MIKEIHSFTDEKPDGRLIHDLEEAAVHVNGFAPEQDSFFVFVMRRDMITELEALADEEGASRNGQLLVCAFSDPSSKTSRQRALFSLHAMCEEAERQGWAYAPAVFAVKVFLNPSFAGLVSACGVPSGYMCAGAAVIGREEKSSGQEARYNVFSYIQ